MRNDEMKSANEISLKWHPFPEEKTKQKSSLKE